MAVLARVVRLPLALALFALGLSPAFAVFGGKPVAGSDPVARSVAAIIYRDSTGAHLCTASVLAPKLLLTAAHCTAGDRQSIKIVFGTSLMFIDSSQIRAASEIVRADKTAVSKGMSAYEDPDDVALVLLDAAAPAGTQIVRLADGAPPGASIDVVGYGATSDLRKPDAAGHQQLGFDQTLRSATMPLLSHGDGLLIADQTHSSGTCTGDSGGPAFLPGKALTVVGVMIGVASPRDNNDYCRGKAYFASVARWTSWINATAARFGQKL